MRITFESLQKVAFHAILSEYSEFNSRGNCHFQLFISLSTRICVIALFQSNSGMHLLYKNLQKFPVSILNLKMACFSSKSLTLAPKKTGLKRRINPMSVDFLFVLRLKLN
jgi:hypothetical protein